MATTMKALINENKGEPRVVDAPIPTLRPDHVMVKTIAVALNPVDAKPAVFVDKRVTLGCDFVGTVTEIGAAVTSPLKVGDRIAGMIHGQHELQPEDGAFAEYCTVKDGLFLRVPEGMRSEDAATLGIGVTTAGQALYQSLGLPTPDKPVKTPFPVLIYGGATATGALAVQFAKLSNLKVLTTSSPKNHAYLRSLGADAVFDYTSPSCASSIRSYTDNKLHLAVDCVSIPSSIALIASSLSTSPPTHNSFPADTFAPNNIPTKNKVATLLPLPSPTPETLETISSLAFSAIGEEMEFVGKRIEVVEGHWEFGRVFWRGAERLFAEGRVRAHTPEVRGGGLEGVIGGLADVRDDRVRGVKVVYLV